MGPGALRPPRLALDTWGRPPGVPTARPMAVPAGSLEPPRSRLALVARPAMSPWARGSWPLLGPSHPTPCSRLTCAARDNCHCNSPDLRGARACCLPPPALAHQ
eukprot:15185757-Alexandrium_andersonii.AAC.1